MSWARWRPAWAVRLPPHGRGWTRVGQPGHVRRNASPARAGMDRWRTRNSGPSCCFPRTGGDGPGDFFAKRTAQMLPPHGRGWTCVSSWMPGVIMCFPRTGGDGPFGSQVCHGLRALPPHGRGWTLLTAHEHLNADASPARAGMDPHWPSRRPLAQSFPRTGGDGPGNPDIVSRVAISRFPRTGGDGPHTDTHRSRQSLLPPHGRGWTVTGPNPMLVETASPARAGMDLSRTRALAVGSGFPRTGGDGPLNQSLRYVRSQASPARAGMDPEPPHRATTSVVTVFALGSHVQLQYMCCQDPNPFWNWTL